MGLRLGVDWSSWVGRISLWFWLRLYDFAGLLFKFHRLLIRQHQFVFKVLDLLLHCDFDVRKVLQCHPATFFIPSRCFFISSNCSRLRFLSSFSAKIPKSFLPTVRCPCELTAGVVEGGDLRSTRGLPKSIEGRLLASCVGIDEPKEEIENNEG